MRDDRCSPRTHTRGLCVAWVPAAGACPCAVRAARLPANAEPEPKEQKKADFFVGGKKFGARTRRTRRGSWIDARP